MKQKMLMMAQVWNTLWVVESQSNIPRTQKRDHGQGCFKRWGNITLKGQSSLRLRSLRDKVQADTQTSPQRPLHLVQNITLNGCSPRFLLPRKGSQHPLELTDVGKLSGRSSVGHRVNEWSHPMPQGLSFEEWQGAWLSSVSWYLSL